MKINSRERVQAAFSREVPDRIPYCELHVDRALGQRIMGWGEPTDQRFNLEANIYSAESFVKKKGDYSAWFVIRVGLFSAMLSMGLEHFCLSLVVNPLLVEKVLDIYFDWMVVVAERINQLDFDVFVSTDDMAFKTGAFFSPEVFERMFLPRYRRVAEAETAWPDT